MEDTEAVQFGSRHLMYRLKQERLRPHHESAELSRPVAFERAIRRHCQHVDLYEVALQGKIWCKEIVNVHEAWAGGHLSDEAI